MLHHPVDINILLMPSARGIAYLNVFKELNIYPSEVVLLRGAVNKLNELIHEDSLFGYSSEFFDLKTDVLGFLIDCGTKLIELDTSDVNSFDVRDALIRCKGRHTIFTGGGILNRETLNIGIKFIHIHPGILPHYRGSTCFYYSLLSDNFVSSTAFVLADGIDTGDVICSSRFKINCKIEPQQPLFMDYILDSYIRSLTLRKVIRSYIETGKVISHKQDKYTNPAYFVIHPFLRYLTVLRVNKNYDSSKPTGIFEYHNP